MTCTGSTSETMRKLLGTITNEPDVTTSLRLQQQTRISNVLHVNERRVAALYISAYNVPPRHRQTRDFKRRTGKLTSFGQQSTRSAKVDIECNRNDVSASKSHCFNLTTDIRSLECFQ